MCNGQRKTHCTHTCVTCKSSLQTLLRQKLAVLPSEQRRFRCFSAVSRSLFSFPFLAFAHYNIIYCAFFAGIKYTLKRESTVALMTNPRAQREKVSLDLNIPIVSLAAAMRREERGGDAVLLAVEPLYIFAALFCVTSVNIFAHGVMFFFSTSTSKAEPWTMFCLTNKYKNYFISPAYTIECNF